MTDSDASPRYYFAVYADPNAADHVTVESGTYGNRGMPEAMAPGDIVLTYCTATYVRYAKSVPGMGIVTSVDHDARRYTYGYVPFDQPVPLDFLRFAFTDADKQRLANMRREFLFEISRESFQAVTSAGVRSESPSLRRRG